MWPLLILAGAAFLFSKQVSTAINQVEVLPRGIKFQRSGLTINLLYTFDIYNPADVAATIDAVSGRILAGTTQLGTFLTREPVIIQARATTTSTATVRIDSITALMQLYKVWQSGKTPTITIQGLLQTKLASIPYTYTVYVGQDLGLKKTGVSGIGAVGKKNQRYNVHVAGLQSHIKDQNYEYLTYSQVLEVWNKYQDKRPPKNLFNGDYHELNSSYNIAVEPIFK